VTLVGGGMWVQRKIGELNLPQLTRPVDEVGAFKFSVRIHAAGVQNLSDPSLLKRERPRVEVVVGQTRKETELGDFRPEARGRASSSVSKKASDDSVAGAEGPACPWHFGDTLTFTATRADVLGPGVQVWLKTQQEVRLGTLLQVNMSQTCEVGMCTVDLRRRVLPACAARDSPDSTGGSNELSGSGPQTWETPVMVMPVTHVGGTGRGPSDKPFVLGESSGHVALSFSVNVDPAMLLKSADEATMPMVQRLSQPLKDWTLSTASSAASATQEWTVKAAGATAEAVKVAAIQTHNALEEPVRWVMENADIEGCTVKTRRQVEDWQIEGCTVKTQKPLYGEDPGAASAFGHPQARQHMPVRLAATDGSPLRVPRVHSVQAAPTLATQPQASSSSSGGAGFVSSVGGLVPRALERPLEEAVLPATGVGAGGGALSSRGAAGPAAPSAALPMPPGPETLAYVATPTPVAAAAAAATGSQGQVGYYVQAGRPGLPSRQSFQVHTGGHPQQVVQVIHGVPAGYAPAGLPTRQSFQVVQPQTVRQAPPQYVRPGSVA